MALASSSRTERYKQGKALRHKTPREAHADLKGSLSRNAVALLAESDRDRVPEFVPERYARMTLNPFAFLRGAAYRTHISTLAKSSPLEIWHSRIDLEQEIKQIGNRDLRRKLGVVIAKARGEGLSKDDNFPHLVSRDSPKIIDKPPTIFHLDPKADARHRLGVERVFAAYRGGLNPDRRRLLDRFTMKDLAFKAVGVGSVGTFCCVALFMTDDNEPLFLQVKQAQRSVLERLDGKLAYKGNQGSRVMQGQQLMQAASDIFLGSTQDDATGRQFYVRTLKNRRLGAVSEISVRRGTLRLCPAMRSHPRACPCALRRSVRDRWLHRQERGTRRRDRFVRDGLCRPDYPRSRRACEGKEPAEIS